MRRLLAALTLLAAAAGPAGAASFDCAEAAAADEREICRDCALSQLDVRMATLYEVLTSLVAMGQRGAIHDDQSAWLKQRAACGADAGCLTRRYEARIEALQGQLRQIYQRGPY